MQGIEHGLFLHDQYPYDGVERRQDPSDGLHLTVRDRRYGKETFGAGSLLERGQIGIMA